ncbi:MAG TPA: DUF4383 domain-containing protein [Actinomycetota bacterium]|nr:DUF4383 domain-containing protein [Actinomycetota bacterium]
MSHREDALIEQRTGQGRFGEWSPARLYLAVNGVWHLVLAVGGFLADQTFPTSIAAAQSGHSGHVFGIFETNGWHTLGAAIIGVVATYTAIYPKWAKEVAFGIGAFHVPFTLALLFWEPHNFLIASNDADQIVHASSAILGLAAAFATPSRAHRRSPDPVTP